MSRTKKKRVGAATVEFAFALPILLLTIFSGIEFARVNMIRNTIENAAYEGAREGIVPGATKAECEAAAQELLDFVRVTGATVVADAITAASTEATVTVTVPLTTANGYVTPRYYLGMSLASQISLPIEKTN